MAEIKGVRYEIIKDKEIYKLLKEKDSLIVKLRAMQEEINKLAADGEIIGAKIQKIKDKAVPKMEKKAEAIELEQHLQYGCPNCKWEVVTSFQIEGDEVTATVTDAVDAEKQRISTAEEQKNEAKNSSPDKG